MRQRGTVYGPRVASSGFVVMSKFAAETVCVLLLGQPGIAMERAESTAERGRESSPDEDR